MKKLFIFLFLAMCTAVNFMFVVENFEVENFRQAIWNAFAMGVCAMGSFLFAITNYKKKEK